MMKFCLAFCVQGVLGFDLPIVWNQSTLGLGHIIDVIYSL
jgi:hypothetical protein